MTNKKIYYRESRWIYLIILGLIIAIRLTDNINFMMGIAILIFVPSIIMNEQKPIKIHPRPKSR